MTPEAGRAETWIAALPKGWEISHLRWLGEIYAGGTPSKSNPAFWADGTVPWLNSGSVNEWIIEEPSAYITEDAFLSSSAKWIPANSLVIALAGQGKTKGLCARVAFPTTCNQSMAAFVPGDKVEARYVQYWLSCNYQRIRNLAGGDHRDGLNLRHVGDIGVPLPPKSIQGHIADYLDRECTIIDRTLNEEERLGDLLAEAWRARRQLLLDAHRIDFANAHLRFVTTCLDSKRIPLNAQERAARSGEFPYWGANAIVGNVDDYLFDEDLVLVGEDGAPFFDPRKDVAFCVSGKIWVNNHAHVLRPANTILPDYLRHVLNTTDYSRYISGSTRDKLTQSDMGNIEVPVPPLEAQAAVVAELSDAEHRLRALRAELAASQQLLRERRQALITAAVTGQLEVA